MNVAVSNVALSFLNDWFVHQPPSQSVLRSFAIGNIIGCTVRKSIAHRKCYVVLCTFFHAGRQTPRVMLYPKLLPFGSIFFFVVSTEHILNDFHMKFHRILILFIITFILILSSFPFVALVASVFFSLLFLMGDTHTYIHEVNLKGKRKWRHVNKEEWMNTCMYVCTCTLWFSLLKVQSSFQCEHTLLQIGF